MPNDFKIFVFYGPSLFLASSRSICLFRCLLFVGGIFALPWLWFVNAFWFRSALFGGPSHLMTTYTRFSLIGSIMYGVALFAWLGVFQDNWQDWDEKGEDLAIIIPKGDP
eukprot:TRINITY_DN5584_c0_g1_i4.p1 TRINITY_DN5584_c0_g1~~TRINITY_DN5584_c0_g1_i4.p1  ORF type:complete len:110 (+),score=23.36 TRINITY_DN5584_c0_g1_i4:253-582(+)